MVDFVPLECLAAGHCAEICQVEGQAADVHRLHEIGLCRGARIEMFRPGNPCIIRALGNKICLRTGDRLRILVRPSATLEGMS
ncbi:MAG: ferrous iron transport protein A [Pirellulales bacterium]|nr:ferrous iron transport protein A [Pirellulales bacterium]